MTTLEDRLRTELPELADALLERTAPRIVAVPRGGNEHDTEMVVAEAERNATRRLSSHRLLTAAAAIAVTLVGAAGIALLRTQQQQQQQAATVVDTSTVPGVEACWRSLDQEAGISAGAGGAAPGVNWPDRESSQELVLSVPGDPSKIRVLLVDERGGFTCKLDRAATAETAVQGASFDTAGIGGTSEPDRHEIQVRSVTDDVRDAGVGSGSTLYVGRAGSAVASIVAVLPDGGRHEGVVDSGWFVIDIDVPDGADLTPSLKLIWTATNGTEYEAESLQVSTAIDFRLRDTAPESPSVFGFEALAPIDVDYALAAVGSVLGKPDQDTGWQPMPESLSCTGAIEYRSLLWHDLRFVIHATDNTGDGASDESVLAAWSIGDAPLNFSPPLNTSIEAASDVTDATGLGLGSSKSAVLAQPFVQVTEDGDNLIGLVEGGTPVVFRLVDERVVSINVEQTDC